MGQSRSLHRRRRVESSWVLDADQLPRPVLAGASGELVVTSREGISPVEVGYLVRNDGAGFLLDAFVAWTPAKTPIRLRLELRPLRFGGSRTYVHCPGCGRRALKLYWPFVGRARFACRGCHELAYRSSSQRPRSLAELRTFIERPRRPLPSPAAASRLYERLRAGSGSTSTPGDPPAAGDRPRP